MALKAMCVVTLSSLVLLTTGASSTAHSVTSDEFGKSLAAAIQTSGAVADGTTLTYTEVEPNGGFGTWPVTETSTVNPDRSLEYRLSARGTLDGVDVTVTTDLRCTSGSKWCWKRSPHEFKDAKWHRVSVRLVLFHSAYDDVMVFAGGPWPEADQYEISTADGVTQTFTRQRPGGTKYEWKIKPASITFTNSCTTCGNGVEAIRFTESFTSTTTPISVTKPPKRFIGLPGDRHGFGTMFPVKINTDASGSRS